MKSKFCGWIDSGHLGWVSINRLRNSFLAKAIMVLSITSFLLANFSEVFGTLGVPLIRPKLLFMGSGLFLFGYLIVIFRIPSEFNSGADIISIVDNMTKIHNLDFLKDRINQTESLHQRLEKKRPFDVSDAILDFAKERVEVTKDAVEDNYKTQARSLYQADLSLRQHDRPYSRVGAMLAMTIGVAFMFCPTLINVVRVIFSS